MALPASLRNLITAMDQIPGEKVYIGGMFALREKTDMKAKAITHVLSVLRLPMDKSLFQDFEHLVVEVDDVEDENLIQHFASTNAFVEKAMASDGAVFIHCAMGKSRSATVLAAYLMKSRQLDPKEAVQRIKQIRPFVEPNPGFMEQLELYHQVKYTTDLDDHPSYKQWLYKRELAESKAAKMAPSNVYFRDAEKNVAVLAQVKEGETPEQVGLTELRCKTCRRTLANSRFLTPHIPKPAQPPAPQTAVPTPCSHHFLEPLSWMRPELEQQKLEGKLDCPKCKAKVGSYAWQGMKCSCGEWVVPGISIARGKVDEIRVKL